MHFSNNVTDIDQAMSIKYNTRVYELRRQGKEVLVMSLGEAYFDIPLLPMDPLPFPDLYHYSHSRGIPGLREKLSRYFGDQYGVPIDPETEILVTAGSKAAIHMTFMSILNPGDEVLLPEPAWVSYTEQIKLCYAKPIACPYDCEVTDYERHITDKTRAIVMNTPHNPRGYTYTETELNHVLDLARRRNLWVLSDEAYSDFLIDDSFVSLGRLDPEKKHAVVFNSMSKNNGISGWRLGYVIAHRSLIDRVLKVNQHLITCPPTILAYYVEHYFDRILEITKPQITQLVRQRQQLARYMDEIGLSYLPGSATYYFFVSIAPSRLGSEEFCDRLLEEKLVCTVPGVGYGDSCDKFIRVSFGTASLEKNKRGLRCIKSLIDQTRRSKESQP